MSLRNILVFDTGWFAENSISATILGPFVLRLCVPNDNIVGLVGSQGLDDIG